MKSIIWLASFPKSGNTWARVFLANYIFGGQEPLGINHIHRISIGDAVAAAYRKVAQGPFNPRDLRQSIGLRNKMLRSIVANKADINFVKSHNQNTKAFGQVLIPGEFSRSAIYILRNPLDVVLSFASHYGHTIDDTIQRLANPNLSIPGDDKTVHQYLGSWSQHVLSWATSRDFPVLFLRYEDMLSDPHAAFSKVIEHIGLPLEPEKLDRAVVHSSFDKLRQQEEKTGFIENSSHQERFFRSGHAGQWQQSLTPEQIARIETDHEKVMRKYGYL